MKYFNVEQNPFKNTILTLYVETVRNIILLLLLLFSVMLMLLTQYQQHYAGYVAI